MNISDQWLAGFFDGEGSVRLQKGFSRLAPNSIRAELKLTGTSLSTLEAIKGAYGGVIRIKNNPTRPCYTLYWSNIDDVKRMATLIGKHSIMKADILALVVEYVTPRSSSTRVRVTARDEEIFSLIAAANKSARYRAPEVLAA